MMRTKLASVLFASVAATRILAAGVPDLINYQGRLLDGTNLVNGAVELSLRIYPSPSGGAHIYEDSNTVTVVDGLYSTFLGDHTTFGNITQVFDTVDAWLEVRVSGTPLTPRERIVSAGYAFMAGSIPDGSVTSLKLADNAVTSSKLATNAVTSVNLAAGSISNVHLGINAVGSSNIQSGAITSNKIASGAVAPNHLVKTYRSGTRSVSMSYAGVETNLVIALSPAFDAAPVVTASGRYEGTVPDDLLIDRLLVTASAATGFSLRLTVPSFTDMDYLEPVTVAGSASAGTCLQVINGRAAVSYVATTFDVMFRRAQDADGQSWGPALVIRDATTESTWLETVQGTPAIAYCSNGAVNSVQFMRANDAGGSNWADSVTVAASDSSSPCLVVVNGNPAISFRDETTSQLKYVRATDATGRTWGVVVTVDTNAGSGADSTIAIVGGNPAIAYDGPTGSIRFARATDASGNAWGTPVVVATNTSSGTSPSMAIVGGRPAIAYNEFGLDRLMFVRASDATGGIWSAPVIVSSNSIPTARSISLLVTNGVTAIAWDVFGTGMFYARASDTNGAAWDPPVTLPTNSNAGLQPSLRLVNGSPGIASIETDTDWLSFIQVTNLQLNVDWIAVEP